MQLGGPGVTVVERPEASGKGSHLAALVAAARAHPGVVVTLVSGTEEVARAVDGPPATVRRPPVWRIQFGTAHRRRVVLMDRDGTIIEDRPYLADPDQVVLLPGALEGMRALSAHGVRSVILTNQSGVARGLIGPAQLAAVHERLIALLDDGGAPCEGIFSCPHAPDAGCECRKPAVGLAHQAAQELGLELSESVVVGDKGSDLELGHRLGVPAILVGTGEGPATLAAGTAVADYFVDNVVGLAGLLAHPAGLPVPAPVRAN